MTALDYNFRPGRERDAHGTPERVPVATSTVKRGRPATNRTTCSRCDNPKEVNGYCRQCWNDYQREYQRRRTRSYHQIKALIDENEALKTEALKVARAEVQEQLADLRRENARMLRHIENVETERRQLREQLTAIQGGAK
jgi:hypothetical protein